MHCPVCQVYTFFDSLYAPRHCLIFLSTNQGCLIGGLDCSDSLQCNFLAGSTIKVFSLSSAQWELKAPCYLLLQFLSTRSQCVLVDGHRSNLVNVVSGVPQGSVLGPQVFLLYTLELFSTLENKLYGYAAESTLVAVVSFPSSPV